MGICLYHGGLVDFLDLVSHADMALSPRVGPSSGVHHEGTVLRALHLDDRVELIPSRCVLNSLRGVASLVVSETELTIDVETPGEEDPLVGECCHMAETSSALNKVLALV